MKKLLLAVTTAAIFGMAVTAQAADKMKACWVYVGPIGDFGYSYQHNLGRLAVQKELGDKVQTSYLENVSEGPDAERAFERLARDHCKIIFGTSFGFMDAEVKVAKKFPNVYFEHATGFKTAKNLGIYNLRWYEGRYIMGQIAAKVSKSHIGGYIVSFPIPEVLMDINAFVLGAHSVDPNFKLKIVWVNSWFDPGKEADAAKALIDQGADVLGQHTDSTAAMQVAEKRGVHAFGQASDMIKFGPHAQLTALEDNWAPYYVSRVKAALDGTWKPDNVWLGIKDDNAVELAPFTNMSDDVKAMAEATRKKIAGGWNPFTGPINKQDGTPWLKDGQVAKDSVLLGMNFYVQGVEGALPK